MGSRNFKSVVKDLLQKLNAESQVLPEKTVQKKVVSPQSVVRDLLRRLNEEAKGPAVKSPIQFEEPSTPPRTGAGVKIEKTAGNSHGIEAIAMAGLREAIQSSNALEGLVDAVKDPNLKSLSLQRGSIGDKGVSALARAFTDGNVTNLLYLDLSDNGITELGFGEFTQALAAGILSGLVSFNLAHNLIREEGSGMLARLFHIGRLPALQHLNLSHCYIGDGGIKSIADAMQSTHFSSWSLQFLDFSANVFGEEGVAALSKAMGMGRLPYLKHLNLSFNMLGEKGALALAEVLNSGEASGLTRLLVSRCYLGDGIVSIAEAVETGKLPNLYVLDLSYNFLGDKGSVALAKALRSGKVSKLQKLVIAQCGIAPDKVELIADAIEIGRVWGLRHLDLSNNYSTIPNSSTDRDAALNFTDSAAKSPSNYYYTNVRKDRGSLSLARVMENGHMDGLQYLNLSQCCMTDDGLIALAEEMEVGHVPKLQRFLLRENDIRSGRAMKALAKALTSGHLSELEELDLGQNSSGDDVNMALAAALEETAGSEFQSPLIKKVRERMWSSKSPVESVQYQALRFVEAQLGFRLTEKPTVGHIWNRLLQRQESSRSTVDDENRDHGQEVTGNDNIKLALFFNVLLVCVWFLAVVISKF